jgi:NADPH2:quinone reductase
MVHLPDSLSYEEGASLLLQGLTALVLVKKAYQVAKGDTVLIHVILHI